MGLHIRKLDRFKQSEKDRKLGEYMRILIGADLVPTRSNFELLKKAMLILYLEMT